MALQFTEPPAPYGELAVGVVEKRLSVDEAEAILKDTGRATEGERRRLRRYINEVKELRAQLRRWAGLPTEPVKPVLPAQRRFPSDN